jgi:hypothetical protein
MAQGATLVTTTLTRAEQITAFLQSPMMPGPHQVKLEHITYLLALILGGEVQESAVKLLMPAITPEHALAIWDEWKGYIHPPPGHPLEGAHE